MEISMTFIRPTGAISSPFASSTVFASSGASAYSESWVTVSVVSGRYNAGVQGKAVGMTAGQGAGGISRFYYASNTDYAQSGQMFYTSFQSYVASSDEIIDVSSDFRILSNESFNTTTARTNLIKIEH
jgi:hypothetical protein